MSNVMCIRHCCSGNSLGSLGDCPLPFHKYFVPIADQIILTLFSDKTALQSWLSVSLCTLCSLNHYSAWRFNEMIRVMLSMLNFLCFYSRIPIFWTTWGKANGFKLSRGLKIVFDWWREVMFGSNYQGFWKPKSSRNQDSILYYWVCQEPSPPCSSLYPPTHIHQHLWRSLSNDDGDSYENFT